MATCTGYNATLNGGSAAANIGYLKSFTVSASMGNVDLTTLYGAGTAAAPNRQKAFQPGLIDPGELTGECLFLATDAGLDIFLTDLKAGTSSSWTVTPTGGNALTFTGFPNKYELVIGGAEEGVVANIGIKISGVITVS